MTIPRIASGLPAALLVLALAAVALAGTAPKPGPAGRRAAARAATVKPRAAAAQAPVPAAPPSATAGMVVGLDPETGQLGPATAEQRLQLFPEEANMISRSTEGLVETPIPGGGFLLDLGGRFQEFSYVRVGPDGKFVFGCAGDAAALRRGLAAPVKREAAMEDR